MSWPPSFVVGVTKGESFGSRKDGTQYTISTKLSLQVVSHGTSLVSVQLIPSAMRADGG